MSFSPIRLNHAVLFVADLERSIEFYQTTFEMRVMAREPRANAAFLRLPRSGNHHDLGLFAVAASGGEKRRGSIGLYHLAWQLDTLDELAEARRVLRENGAFTGQSSHGATKSVYGKDPDGNEFEVMWMLPREAGGSSPRRLRWSTSTSKGTWSVGPGWRRPASSASSSMRSDDSDSIERRWRTRALGVTGDRTRQRDVLGVDRGVRENSTEPCGAGAQESRLDRDDPPSGRRATFDLGELVGRQHPVDAVGEPESP